MNILFIVPYVPNLIRTRPYNLVRYMARLGHQVTVGTLWTDDREKADLALLRNQSVRVEALQQARWRSIWNCLAALPTHTPLQAVYSWNPMFARLSGSLLDCNGEDPIDVIHVEHLRGARYVTYLKSRYPDTPIVWDSVDCISYLFEQAARQSRSGFGKLITGLDLNRTRRYEGWLPTQVDHVVITSLADRQALLDLQPVQQASAPISIVPNGVDCEYFCQRSGVERESATVVLSGKMSYHANVSMALFLVNEVMPIVWANRPDVQVLIVGKDPPASVRSLAQNPAVTVTGTVDDIRPYLQKASVAVVPLLYGAGVQNKVLEAMACGIPVVATSQAVQSLGAVVDRDILLGDSPEELARQILGLVKDPDSQKRVGQAGRHYVEEHHQWARIAKVLEGVYDEVVNTRRERRLQ
jgi:glycosyltransferase involved in cell wall biosynthesis